MKTMSHFLKTTQGQFLASVGLIIVVLFAFYFYSMAQNPQGQETVAITVSQNDHVRGAKDGQLTLVEFADFQCPACGAYETILRQVLSDNKDDLKIVFKHFPLTQIHANALLASKAAESAGVQGKFWEMHDLIYDKQEEWSPAVNARDFFLAYATTLGLDTKKFLADLDSKAIEDKIMAEYQEGIKLGVQGTPTFFLNGKKLENVGNLESFNKAVKNAIPVK
jgi:protein-disulfide isomerase